MFRSSYRCIDTPEDGPIGTETCCNYRENRNKYCVRRNFIVYLHSSISLTFIISKNVSSNRCGHKEMYSLCHKLISYMINRFQEILWSLVYVSCKAIRTKLKAYWTFVSLNPQYKQFAQDRSSHHAFIMYKKNAYKYKFHTQCYYPLKTGCKTDLIWELKCYMLDVTWPTSWSAHTPEGSV
jgi:hypothetical protein